MQNLKLMQALLTDIGVDSSTDLGKVYDLRFPIDTSRGYMKNTESLERILPKEDMALLYTDLILNWYLNITRFDDTSWGWYRRLESSQEEPLPLLYKSMEIREPNRYCYKGLAVNPDNMVLVVKHTVYTELLKKYNDSISSVITNEWCYDKSYVKGFPAFEVLDFAGKLQGKCNFVKSLLKGEKV